MSLTKKCLIVLVLAAFSGLMLRLPALSLRPMHTDEAVHAEKFSLLLEKGIYCYDPVEYHGPVLNYITLIPAALAGEKNYASINEFTLRIVPVFFGIGLIFVPLLFINGLGRSAATASVVLTALSPAFVFYSRYYIQEMLLVFFTAVFIASIWRYSRKQCLFWAVMAGLSAGLMYAAKETCIIAFGAIVAAFILAYLTSGVYPALKIRADKFIFHSFLAFFAAVVIAVLFYSSFFTNLPGITDSLTAYLNFFKKGAQSSLHIHPWYYYLNILMYFEFFEKVFWNEDIIVVLACIGFVAALKKKHDTRAGSFLLRFLAFYTLAVTVIFSAIPYKTPWNMLTFLYGMILLAGVGADWLMRLCSTRRQNTLLFFVFAVFAVLSPALQSYLLNFRYYAEPSNPYVYAHTGRDIFPIVQRIEQVAAVHPDGRNMYIEIACSGGDYWPLSWYLRSFHRVGYWERIDNFAPAAQLIIATADLEPDILHKLYELPLPGQKNLYVPLFDKYMQLRPGVELRGYITRDLAEKLIRSSAD